MRVERDSVESAFERSEASVVSILTKGLHQQGRSMVIRHS